MYNRLLNTDRLIIVRVWIADDLWVIIVIVLDSSLWLDKCVFGFDLKEFTSFLGLVNLEL